MVDQISRDQRDRKSESSVSESLGVQVSQDIEFLGHFENREPRPRKMRVYTRRGKRCIVSDLFYSEVGRLDQFTKYPVEHEGPVIISMI